MAEESNSKIERLEKASPDQQGQMVEMMEMLKTLVRDKTYAAGQQSNVSHPNQIREDPAYQQGFTPPYAQTQPMPQMGGFSYDYAFPPAQTNEVG